MSLHSIHEGKLLFFSRCAFKKIINFFEVKVDVQKGALRIRGKVDSAFVDFIQFTFSSIVVIFVIILNDYHVHSCLGL